MQFNIGTKTHTNDRFIPSRSQDCYGGKLEVLDELLAMKSKEEPTEMHDENNETINQSNEPNEQQQSYQSLLQNQLLGIHDAFTIHQLRGTSHIFNGYPFMQRFSLLQNREESNVDVKNNQKMCEKENEGVQLPSCCGFQESDHKFLTPLNVDRKIARVPFKVLDAPALQDDFYLNVVDWSTKGLLAVGLGSCVYLWSPKGKVTKLSDVGQTDSITSVNWQAQGDYLSIGTYSGIIQVWDIKKSKPIRTIRKHESRVGSIATSTKIIGSGSRDKSILLTDLREKEESFAQLIGHKQEVCGLKWSPDEQQLASGGNDNKLFVWSSNNFSRPSCKFTSHTAAVKAIAWSPHQHGLLVSGGGTADRCIRSWDTLNNNMLGSIDVGSQVCSLLFSNTVDELVSSHGYSQNHIYVWKHSNMRKLATLTGHTSRVLYLAASNDGETIVSGAGDETLRFWKVFPPSKSNIKNDSVIMPSGCDMR
jgi:cell division cycle 20-like protein 1 (cofactor of APC complex)